MYEAYIEVLKEAFFSNFLFTYEKEMGFPLLVHFGESASTPYDNYIGLIFALLGSVFALFLTFLIMYLLAKKFHKFLDRSVSYEPFSDFLNTYKIPFLALVMIPEASILAPFFAGIVKMNIVKFLIICTIYRFLFYMVILFYPEIYW